MKSLLIFIFLISTISCLSQTKKYKDSLKFKKVSIKNKNQILYDQFEDYIVWIKENDSLNKKKKILKKQK